MPLLNGPDPFWHWDVGRRIVQSGLPRTDPYSFLTAHRDWVLNQWGADWVFGLMDRLGGLPLLAVAAALLVGAGVALTGWQMWQQAPSLWSVGLLALVMMASLGNWSLRGNLFTFLLIPLLLAELRRERTRPLPILGLLVLWANLHATFLLGLGLSVLSAVSRAALARDLSPPQRLRTPAILLLGGTLAGAATPYGFTYYASIVDLLSRSSAGTISEWGPPQLLAPQVLPYTILVAIVLVSIAWTATRNDLPAITIIVATALFGLQAVRNIAPAAIVVGIVGVPYVRLSWEALIGRDPSPPGAVRRRDRVAAAAVGTMATLGTLIVVPWSTDVGDHTSRMPLETIAHLDQLDREARVFVSSFWAPAVASLTGPHVRTAVDGRLELFTDAELQDFQLALQARHGWQAPLDRWCVTDVVVPESSPLHDALTDADPAVWQIQGSTPPQREASVTAIWFTRTTPPDCNQGNPAGLSE
jgi:hypothetical protein